MAEREESQLLLLLVEARQFPGKPRVPPNIQACLHSSEYTSGSAACARGVWGGGPFSLTVEFGSRGPREGEGVEAGFSDWGALPTAKYLSPPYQGGREGGVDWEDSNHLVAEKRYLEWGAYVSQGDQKIHRRAQENFSVVQIG